MDAVSRTCEHCGTQNFVAECRQDGRRFVLTTAHLEGRLREFDDGPIQELPVGFELPLCRLLCKQGQGAGTDGDDDGWSEAGDLPGLPHRSASPTERWSTKHWKPKINRNQNSTPRRKGVGLFVPMSMERATALRRQRILTLGGASVRNDA